ncbi:MAG: YkvA family protein [Halobacteriaceae archaeon]
MSGGSLRQRVRALREEVAALAVAARDPRTPWYARALLGLVVGLAVSPVDPIPDFVPVLGHLDDLVFVPLGVALARRAVPGEVLADARERAGEPDGAAGWVGAALVVLAWAGLALAAVYTFQNI